MHCLHLLEITTELNRIMGGNSQYYVERNKTHGLFPLQAALSVIFDMQPYSIAVVQVDALRWFLVNLCEIHTPSLS